MQGFLWGGWGEECILFCCPIEDFVWCVHLGDAVSRQLGCDCFSGQCPCYIFVKGDTLWSNTCYTVAGEGWGNRRLTENHDRVGGKLSLLFISLRFSSSKLFTFIAQVSLSSGRLWKRGAIPLFLCKVFRYRVKWPCDWTLAVSACQSPLSVLSLILGKCCSCRGLGCPSSEAVSASQNIPTNMMREKVWGGQPVCHKLRYSNRVKDWLILKQSLQHNCCVVLRRESSCSQIRQIAFIWMPELTTDPPATTVWWGWKFVKMWLWEDLCVAHRISQSCSDQRREGEFCRLP